MVRVSVSEAAARLGVSPVRVRQRIAEGSVVAEKVGGRWLVDLDSAPEPAGPVRGRPVSPRSVWFSLLALDAASFVDVPGAEVVGAGAGRIAGVEAAWPAMADQLNGLSPASRHRAVARLGAAIGRGDEDAVLGWLRNRGARRLFVAAEADLESLRADGRFLVSGVSDPESGMSDPRIAEGYVAEPDLDAMVADFWLDPLSPGDRANVVLHVVPALPPRVSRLLLGADLAEHGGPREVGRAHELLAKEIHRLGERR